MKITQELIKSTPTYQVSVHKPDKPEEKWHKFSFTDTLQNFLNCRKITQQVVKFLAYQVSVHLHTSGMPSSELPIQSSLLFYLNKYIKIETTLAFW